MSSRRAKCMACHAPSIIFCRSRDPGTPGNIILLPFLFCKNAQRPWAVCFSPIPVPSSLISMRLLCHPFYTYGDDDPAPLPTDWIFHRFVITCLIFSLSANTFNGESHPFLMLHSHRGFPPSGINSQNFPTSSWITKFCMDNFSSPLSRLDILIQVFSNW